MGTNGVSNRIITPHRNARLHGHFLLQKSLQKINTRRLEVGADAQLKLAPSARRSSIDGKTF